MGPVRHNQGRKGAEPEIKNCNIFLCISLILHHCKLRIAVSSCSVKYDKGISVCFEKKVFFCSLISSNIKMAITILMSIIHNIIDNDYNKADIAMAMTLAMVSQSS